MTSGTVREQEVPPRAAALVESLRDIGYSLQTATADIVDNSLTAGARRIDLLADTHAVTPAIGILDDGSGMTETELLEAMRPGSRSPLENRPPNDLGRFGLGLKTASFSQCRRLSVVTRRDGEVSCAVWDLDTVAARDKWIIGHPDPRGIRWFDRLVANGTLVVWEKLDRLLGADRPDLVRQLDETATHLEFVFHRFLSGSAGKNRSVKMYLNGRELQPFDPFHSHHPATQHHSEEILRLNGKEIRIQPVTLPHHDKVSKADWSRYAGPEGYVKNQGFYLYRNGRLIVHGTWFRLMKQLELTRLSRVRIDIPNSLDAEWKIDIKKASAQPPPPVRERLRRIIEHLGAPSKRTYKARGARLIDDNRMPVWTRSQDKDRILYGLNREHPLLFVFENQLDEETTKEFRRLVGLVVSSLPVEAIHADVSESPESVEPDPLDEQEFEEIVTAVWSVLRERRVPIADIKARLRSASPFMSRWAETEGILLALEAQNGKKQ